jgi:hypothetical protein
VGENVRQEMNEDESECRKMDHTNPASGADAAAPTPIIWRRLAVCRRGTTARARGLCTDRPKSILHLLSSPSTDGAPRRRTRAHTDTDTLNARPHRALHVHLIPPPPPRRSLCVAVWIEWSHKTASRLVRESARPAFPPRRPSPPCLMPRRPHRGQRTQSYASQCSERQSSATSNASPWPPTWMPLSSSAARWAVVKGDTNAPAL